MNVLDLFSGIGGFSLGLERAGMQTVAFCEIEPYCRTVLAKHWPGVPCYDDIRKLTAERLKADGIAPIDVICGGAPCQPYSVAGKQLGEKDDRALWHEYLRLVEELRPTWVIGENVVGFIGLALDNVLTDLEALGYATRTFDIPASSIGAQHERRRVFIVGRKEHDAEKTDDGWYCTKCGNDVFGGCEHYHGEWECRDCGEWTYPFYYYFSEGCQCCGSENVAYPVSERGRSRVNEGENATDADNASQVTGGGDKWWEAEPEVGRLAYGFSDGLDRSRLKALGNAVVPQIPEIIGRAIMQAEGLTA